jgi:LuxR family maltose regulon positive regulatory protein
VGEESGSSYRAAGQVPLVLEDKLHPPVARAQWIERPRLLQRVARVVDHRILLVAAPAGYGKTIAVTQWVTAPESGRSAWVHLDPGDNDPSRLWAHVAAALERAGCPVDAGLVAAHSRAILTQVLPRIIGALGTDGRPLTIVLNDLHVVRSRECSDQLDELIARLPDHVHLVLISRTDPQLRLGRLRVEGELAEIRAADLAFTHSEVAEVLQAEDILLPEAAVGELVRLTEGWPAAVYLAALSLVGREDPEGFLRTLGGSSRLIADYLSEEVLGRQDADLHDFILDMSIFDHFNAGLADHVRRTRVSAGLLHRLERTNMFLSSMQEEGWVRFHHLFAAFAQSALEVERPEMITELHLRGAEWFLARGQVEDAVPHFLAAGAYDQAANLIQANWLLFFDAGRSATILGWLGELRGTPADAGPAVAVTAAWVAALTGDQVEMRRRLQELESMVDDSPLPDGTKSPRSAWFLVRAMFGFDGPEQMLADAHRAVQLEDDSSTPWYAVARSALGYAGYLIGDVELARQNLRDAARAAAAPTIIQMLALGTLALCEAEQGNTTLSARLGGEAMDLVTDHPMAALPQVTLASAAYGAALAEQDRLDDARALLQAGLDARRRLPGLSPWPLVHLLLAMAALAARSGDETTTEALLAEVGDLTPWSEDGMAATRIRIAAIRNLLNPLPEPQPQPVGVSLTAREVEILRRLRGSQTLREIAADLYVSHNTVKTITLSLYRKLGAHSRAEAVEIAARLRDGADSANTARPGLPARSDDAARGDASC